MFAAYTSYQWREAWLDEARTKPTQRGLTLTQLIEIFPNNRVAEAWFEAKR